MTRKVEVSLKKTLAPLLSDAIMSCFNSSRNEKRGEKEVIIKISMIMRDQTRRLDKSFFDRKLDRGAHINQSESHLWPFLREMHASPK